MARSRTIKPGFFKNEDLAELSPYARLLFAGLWTLADREGRLEYRPKKIKVEILPYDAVEIHDLAVELHGKKFIVLYEVDGTQFLAIPSFKVHQRPHPKEPKSEIPQPPDTSTTYDKAVKKHGEPCKETAGCAFPSSNPLILQSSNPNGSSPETGKPSSGPPPEKSLLTFPCDGKPREWHYCQSYEDELVEAYPSLDVRAEIRKSLQWVRAKPGNRKTASGMKQFIVNWLNKATNSGNGRKGDQRNGTNGGDWVP